MPAINAADRVSFSVTATESGDWQLVDTPTSFQAITSANFSDGDYVTGYVLHENGEDWEVYDGDTTDALLVVANLSGTLTLTRPATPFASTNSGNRIAAGTGTHTFVLTMGAGAFERFLRETNPSWNTFTGADATPSVQDYRYHKTSGTTTITRFDNMHTGQMFIVLRGDSDIEIEHNASIICPGAENITLTVENPSAIFAEDGGVAKCLVSGQSFSTPLLNQDASSELTVTAGAITPTLAAHTIDTEGDAASDDLVTINGANFQAGNILYLSVVNASRVVTLKNGTGNLALPNNEDIVLSDPEQTVPLRFDGSSWNYAGFYSDFRGTEFFGDGGTIAADGNNEITVEHRKRYRLTASDSIAGVIGLADGQSAQLYSPATGSTTLEDAGTVTAGVALALSGADKVISSVDDSLFTITRVGSGIRIYGGGASGSYSVVSSIAALKAVSTASLSTGDTIVVTGYYASNDGGGGTYVFTSGGTGSDNGGTIIDATDAGGHFDLITFGGAVDVRQFGAKASGSDADATVNRTAFENAIAAVERIIIPAGAGAYYVDAADPLTDTGTHNQYGAIVIGSSIEMIGVGKPVIKLSDDNFTSIFQVVSACGRLRISGVELDHNAANNFLVGASTISNISQSLSINHVSPITVHGGRNLVFEDIEVNDTIYGGINLSPYSRIEEVRIIGLSGDGDDGSYYAGIHTNGDVATIINAEGVQRIVNKLVVDCVNADKPITELMDINGGVISAIIRNVQVSNPYTQNFDPSHKEVIDIQDCEGVLIDGCNFNLGDTSATGLRVKGAKAKRIHLSNTTIYNGAREAYVEFVSTNMSDWTVLDTGVTNSSGTTLSWSGASGTIKAQQTQHTSLGAGFVLGENESVDPTLSKQIEVSVTITNYVAGDLYATFGDDTHLGNGAFLLGPMRSNGTYTAILPSDGVDRITLQGLSNFEGDVDVSDCSARHHPGAGIVCARTVVLTADNSTIQDIHDGVAIIDQGATQFLEDFKVDGLTIRDVENNAIGFYTGTTTSPDNVTSRVMITNNNFYDVGRSCVRLFDCSNVLIASNLMESSSGKVNIDVLAKCSNVFIDGNNFTGGWDRDWETS